MDLATIIQRVDERKTEIDALRPIEWEQEQRIMQKFRIDWNYHSGAIEGNMLTYGETRAFLLYGITAHGKPFRDYLDIKGHQAAIEYLEAMIRQTDIAACAADLQTKVNQAKSLPPAQNNKTLE